MTEEVALTIVGTDHDYSVGYNGKMFADVWHSDKNEWSIATTDGPVYRRRTSDEALELCRTLALGQFPRS